MEQNQPAMKAINNANLTTNQISSYQINLPTNQIPDHYTSQLTNKLTANQPLAP
jgi:hypothetical protein